MLQPFKLSWSLLLVLYIYSQNYICKVSRCSESVCPHVVDIHMHICLCIWCGGMGLACLTLCLSLIESLSLSLPLVKATLVDFQTVQDLWSPPFACPYNIWHMYSIQIYIYICIHSICFWGAVGPGCMPLPLSLCLCLCLCLPLPSSRAATHGLPTYARCCYHPPPPPHN